jgi:hypothetical protein
MRKQILRCSCRSCRRGLHRGSGFEMTKCNRTVRRRTTQLLKAEDYDAAQDVIISCPYTD